MQVFYFYANNLGVDMGERRALEGCMDNCIVTFTSLRRNIHSLFAKKAAHIFRIPVETFKSIQLYALSIDKCQHALGLVGSMMVKNLKGEKNA